LGERNEIKDPDGAKKGGEEGRETFTICCSRAGAEETWQRDTLNWDQSKSTSAGKRKRVSRVKKKSKTLLREGQKEKNEEPKGVENSLKGRKIRRRNVCGKQRE